MKSLAKDPDEKKDYGFNWAPWLGSDTILSSAWVVPGGITQSSSPAPSFDATTTTIWLEGGSVGTDYEVINRITTVAGRIAEQAFRIICRASTT
jgi:hypothetical protein